MGDGVWIVGGDAEATQRRTIEDWIDSHPGWFTVGEIRDGIEADLGIRIERIQGRLDQTHKYRRVLRRQNFIGAARSGNRARSRKGSARTTFLIRRSVR